MPCTRLRTTDTTKQAARSKLDYAFIPEYGPYSGTVFQRVLSEYRDAGQNTKSTLSTLITFFYRIHSIPIFHSDIFLNGRLCQTAGRRRYEVEVCSYFIPGMLWCSQSRFFRSRKTTFGLVMAARGATCPYGGMVNTCWISG